MTIEPPRIPVATKRTSRFKIWSTAEIISVLPAHFESKFLLTYNVQEDHNYDDNSHFHLEQFDFTLFLKLPLIILNVISTVFPILKEYTLWNITL